MQHDTISLDKGSQFLLFSSAIEKGDKKVYFSVNDIPGSDVSSYRMCTQWTGISEKKSCQNISGLGLFTATPASDVVIYIAPQLGLHQT